MSDATSAAPAARAARLKEDARERIQRLRPELLAISHELHAHPETAWNEHRSTRLLTDELAVLGMTVQAGVADLSTAFLTTIGSGGTVVALVAEYDALAGLGHACGHNIIAAAAVGAAAGLIPLVAELGITLRVYGTPAEEGGGGKILMLDAGAFDDVDVAVMIHPGPADSAIASPLAVAHFDVAYTGAEAHASAYPERGVNAADAFTVAQVAIGLLRQQLPAGVKVHGIVRQAGTAPNAIPARSVGSWYVRAPTLALLEGAFARVVACFEAGALATACTVAITETSPRYSEFRNDERLVDAFVRNARALGREFGEADSAPGGMNTASTDMANLSQRVRAIHPYLGIGSLPAVNHQAAFAAATVTSEGDQAVVDGAILLAQTIIDDVIGR